MESILFPIADVLAYALFAFAIFGFLYGRIARKLPWSVILLGLPIAVVVQAVVYSLVFGSGRDAPRWTAAVLVTIASIELARLIVARPSRGEGGKS